MFFIAPKTQQTNNKQTKNMCIIAYGMAYYQSKIKETLQTVKRSFNHCSLYLGYSGFLLHFCFLVVKGTLTYRLFDLFEEKGSFF